jgi:hypothetical protein
MPATRFVYLTVPQNDTIILNINNSDNHLRFQVSRDQLFQLNRQIADLLIKNQFGDDSAQLVLNLEKAATL